MSFRAKLIAIVLFVALVPLTVSALTAMRVHQRAFDGQIAELHRRVAEAGATVASAYLEEATRALGVLAQQTIRWRDLTPEQRESALWLVYRQRDEIAVASLLDDEGRGVGASAYLEAAAAPVLELAAHPTLRLEDLDAFGRMIHLGDDPAPGTASVVGPFSTRDGHALAVLTFRVDAVGGGPAIVAVGLSLRRLCAQVQRHTEGSLHVDLTDAGGRAICGAGAEDAPPALASSASSTLLRYHDAGGDEVVATRAPALHGWSIWARQPAEQAFAASRRLRWQGLFWIAVSLAVALTAGIYLARSVARPVKVLATAAGDLAAGRFDRRVPAGDRDELGALALAFNDMGEQIQRRDAEIRTWNEELQARVEARTAELRDAQAQLLQSQKMAAISTLGAGFAHEINNPLTGVLGLTQVLLGKLRREGGRDAQVQMLARVESEAHRIREIVERLAGLIKSAERPTEAIAPAALVDAALRAVEPRLAAAGIVAVRDVAATVPEVQADALQFGQALSHLLDNAITAMPEGGTLTVGVRSIEGQLVRIDVRDTGRGIATENLDKVFEPFFTTKADWRGQGLGLALAYQTVTAHAGTIKLTSAPGAGTTVTITMPVARRGAHLV